MKTGIQVNKIEDWIPAFARMTEKKMDTQFKVKTAIFEGPLDLLLSLIEERKLLINEVALAKVADDFIGYVRSLQEFPIAESAHFILVASTLLLIKSKSLLPSLSLSPEEAGDIRMLEHRLMLYNKVRNMVPGIRERFGKEVTYFRQRKIEPVFSPEPTLITAIIFEAMRRVLTSLPQVEKLSKAVVKKIISLEDMIANLTERIQNRLSMSFREFSGIGKKDKVTVIVSFLALLELVKQGIVNVVQNNHHEDIHIETESMGVPKYGRSL